MSDITLVSKEYAESVFTTGPVVKEITSSDGSVSVFVNGPNVDLKVKSGGSIDENRVITGKYESYGYSSNRFIADSKINAIRLGRRDFNTNIEEGSINVHAEDGGVNADFTVQAFVGAFTPGVNITIPDSGVCSINLSAGANLINIDSTSGVSNICFNIPAYFKTIYISDSDSFNYSAKAMYYDPFMNGALCIGDGSFCDTKVDGQHETCIHANGRVAVSTSDADGQIVLAANHELILKVDNIELTLDSTKLNKLKEWLES